MSITLGDILTNTRRTLKVEVLDGGYIIGHHKYDKIWASHSFVSLTDEDTKLMTGEVISELFDITRPMIDELMKEL